MGCTTSHDAFAAAVTSSARRAHASSPPASRADPAALCRERVALIRAAADRRFALAAAHAAYFRSLAAVGDALRRFAAAALAPAPGSSPVLTLPPSPAKQVAAATVSSLPPSPSSSSTVSALSHSLSDDDDDLDDALHHDHAAKRGGDKAASSSSASTRHHYMRSSFTVPATFVYDDPNAQTTTQYTQAEEASSYGYGHAYYGYPYPYPYGPYGEVVAGDAPEPEAAAPRQPPSPPAAEVSPWEFLDPFTQYDQFMEGYGRGNLPTDSPNYADLRRMEGIPELEDEAELERKAEASSTSAGASSDQHVKGKKGPPVQDNAASNGDSSGAMLQRNAGSNGASSSAKQQRNGSEPPPGGGKSQTKGSEPAPDAEGKAGKHVSKNDSAPSNASSKSKEEGGKKSTVSLKGTASGDIDGSSTSGKKKGVAFDEERSIRAAGGGGESHGKSVQSVLSSESFSPLHNGTRDVREAMDEVKELFDAAVNCSEEVSRLLEVGKMPPRTTPRVLRCGHIFQSGGSSWSYRVDIVLPPKTTWQEVKSIKQQGEHFSLVRC